jgi:glycosyltransferase involved in cell wall biosynthesis
MDYVVLQEILHLQQMDKENEYFVFVKPGPDRCVQSTENVHVIELGMPSYPLWEQIALPRAARKAKVDILHCTSNTAPINCKIPLVLTLHDIIFLEPRDKANKSVYQNLGWVYRRWNVPRIMSNCRRIITVSNFELQNIICKTGVEENRMVMIYNGYNDIFQQLSDVNQVYRKYINEPGYLLFLGNTDPKKNTERTLIAYSLYLEQSKVKRKLLVGDIDQPYLEDIINRNRIDNIH